MPTNKPKIQTIIRKKYYEKLVALTKKEERTMSQLTAKILEEYIENYEKEHGNIIIEDEKDKVIDFKNDMKPFA